jgi:polar amino acid transport system substrate-binding protein
MTESQRALFSMVDFQHGIIKNCLKNRSPVLVPAYSIHQDWIPEIYEALCFESFILYPLYAGQRLVGVLALFRREPLHFGDRHLMLLQMISNQMAIAVLNAQTYSDMRNITNNLERELGLKASQLQVSELALVRKSNELAAVFDAITDALFVADGNFVIRDVNQAGLRFAGVANTMGLLNRSYCEVVGKRYNCGNCYLRQTLDSGLPQTVEIEIDDRVFTVTTYPVLDEEGKTNQVVCALRDVTIVRKKGAELIQSQKMQAVGILAAGVAHEIRNPLGAISNYVYILEEQMLPRPECSAMVEPSEIRETLSGIRRLVERSESVIRNLLDFSRDKAPNISSFPLRTVIDQILLLVGKTAQKKKVEIFVLGDPNATVTSDTGAMQHILFNLVLNAIDAIESGGVIEVRYSSDESGFWLVVEDNGSGIAREHMEKIFNPFFTTKAPDRGTGLGLYLVYNEVRRLGGTISVESVLGGPTKFTVQFLTGGKEDNDNGKR